MMNSKVRLTMMTLMIGVFMGALDNGIITSSLTTLIHSFEVSPSWGAWIITIYTLGLTISVPIVGKLSDRYGRRALFLIEISLFGIGSLLVALSPTFTFLLIARFFQALGGGGIFILASSYILDTFPKERQGRALGMLGGMNGIASVLGPNIGSLILSVAGSWHWLFLINIPIAILLLILGSKSLEKQEVRSTSRLDIAGILVLSGASLSLMYGLTQLKGTSFKDVLTSASFLTFVLVGIAMYVLFFFLEKRVETKGTEPVLPISMLKTPTYRWSLVLALLSGGILASVIFIPSYVEQYLGVASSMSGYWFTPLALAAGIGAAMGGIVIDKKGPTFTMFAASIIAMIGYVLFPLWVEHTWQMVIASIFVGIGFGTLIGAPINMIATEHIQGNKGVALAGVSLIRQMGMTIAPTIYASFLTRGFAQFGEVLQRNAAEAGVDLSQGGMAQLPKDADMTTLMSMIDQIPSKEVKELLLKTVHDASGIGFDGLFYAAAVVAAIMLITVIIVHQVRKRAGTPASSAHAK